MPAVLLRLVALAVLALTADLATAQLNLLPLPGGVRGFPVSPINIDPVLSSVLRSAGLDQPIEAVLTFDHYPTAGDLVALRATGVQVRPLRALPMVGVQGTSPQILILPALPGLRSIYFNRRLSYFVDESVPLIGANRLWSKPGVTGKGVAMAVIDSGIDATHRDLPFGTKVVQNVKLAPDLFGSGPLVLEGLSTTDTSSGHGTHVAGIAGGSGAALAGKYRGVAIDSKLVGIGAGEAQAVGGADRVRLVGEAAPVHGPEEPVARPVAGEHPPRAVPAVRGRGQPHDQQPGRGVAEAGDGPGPVVLVTERGPALATDLLPPGDQPGAGSA